MTTIESPIIVDEKIKTMKSETEVTREQQLRRMKKRSSKFLHPKKCPAK